MSKKLDKVLYEISLFKRAMEHSSPEALKQYLKDHPGADPDKHTVREKEEKSEKQDSKPKKSVQEAKKAVEAANAKLKEEGITGDYRTSLEN